MNRDTQLKPTRYASYQILALLAATMLVTGCGGGGGGGGRNNPVTPPVVTTNINGPKAPTTSTTSTATTTGSTSSTAATTGTSPAAGTCVVVCFGEKGWTVSKGLSSGATPPPDLLSKLPTKPTTGTCLVACFGPKGWTLTSTSAGTIDSNGGYVPAKTEGSTSLSGGDKAATSDPISTTTQKDGVTSKSSAPAGSGSGGK
ncbi:MAG: hypothetical protein HY816_23520 [Candidatus Wallbacteria bacterium]|nr:hypothetical protein [Candidatus Wallbacteria bacterium]